MTCGCILYSMCEVVLVPASAAQLEISRQNTFEAWGAPKMTIDQYLTKEHELQTTPFSMSSLTSFVLVPIRDQLTVDIRGVVEIYQRNTTLFARGVVRHVPCFGVASVFVPKKYRRQGLASKMMALVQTYMKEHGGEYYVSNLYSEIGNAIYSDLGWVAHPCTEIELSDTHNFTKFLHHEPSVTVNDIDSYATLDWVAKEDRMFMTANILSLKEEGIHCYIDFTSDGVIWFQKRCQVFAKIFTSFEIFPQVLGAYVTDSEGRAACRVVWAHNFKDNVLMILRWECGEDLTIMGSLLLRVMEELRTWKLQSVVFWNPPLALRNYVSSYFTAKQRGDSLSFLMVAYCDPLLSVPKILDSVHWKCDEKYAWI